MTPREAAREIIASLKRSPVGLDDADRWAEALIKRLEFDGYEIRKIILSRPVLHSAMDTPPDVVWSGTQKVG